jgi:AcrR family transcriptional regulator
MKPNQPAGEAATTEATTSWRELAVARSLDSARMRAETRVQRFLDAAVELMNASPGKEFTVQEVVERSGQSLRSFYQYFAGKHELLLALFEESVRSTAEHLRECVAEEDDPMDRLHRFVVEYYRLCRPTARSRSVKRYPIIGMADFAQQLLTEYPKEASIAFVPLVSLLDELLEDATAAGLVRSDVHRGRATGVILQAVMFNVFATTISGSSGRGGDSASEDLWNLILHGIGQAQRA